MARGWAWRDPQRVRGEVVRVATAGLGRLSDDEVRALVEDFLVPRLIEEPVVLIAGALLEGVVDEQTHHGLVDLGLEQLRDWLADNPGRMTAPASGRRGGRRRGSTTGAIGWTVLAARHPAGPTAPRARQVLDDLLKRLAADQHDPEVMARAESLKERLLTHSGRCPRPRGCGSCSAARSRPR